MTHILDRDLQSIWHPFTQYGIEQEFLPVSSASGSTLKLEDGREVLDMISSWWVNIHGHSHPRIVEAIARQAAKLDHVIFAGFTHEPAVQLAELLLNHPFIKRSGLSRVFYSDNGSTAVEVALKIAYQYHLNRGVTGRERFLALSDSYHGDTLGAMAVGEPAGYHAKFKKLLPQVDFVNPNDLEDFKTNLRTHADSYAAFIYEPLVQGAAGMKMYSRENLGEMLKLCRHHGILTIADEIFTGFYRTGKCFASEHVTSAHTSDQTLGPDLMCLSKGITGGTLPLSATLVTETLFKGFISPQLQEAFLHGHSYTANPIACAVAVESWKLLHSDACQKRIQEICAATQKCIQSFEEHPRVKAVRNLGTIGAIELAEEGGLFAATNRGSVREFRKFAIQHGVLLRPIGNVIYTVPPYSTTVEEIHRAYEVVREWLSQEK